MPQDNSKPLADRRIPTGGDYLSREELAKLTTAELTRRVRELARLAAAHAQEAEALRRPVDAVWNALRATGFFYQFIPKRFGGLETDFDSFIDASMILAEACPSTSWVATFCAEHNWILSHFPLETQEKLWGGDFPYIIAPYASTPPGTATPVEGGYRVSGCWKWGTGVMHADWVMLNTLSPREGGPPVPVMVLIPADKVTVIDTWNVSGMCGTGSNDILVEDVFVPMAHTVANLTRSGRHEGARDHANPIYGVPMLPFLAMSASIPALGAARSMVTAFKARLTQHVRVGSQTANVEKATPQIRLAEADMMVTTAELLIRDAGRKLLEIAKLEEPDQTPPRLAVRAQLAYAVSLCVDAAVHLNRGAGSGAHMLDNSFQRALRDILMVSTHIVFDVDVANELHGRAMVGLPPNSMVH